MELTRLEKGILKVISQEYPYTFDGVYDVWKRVDSFDKTIKTLDLAMRNGTTPIDMVNMAYFV